MSDNSTPRPAITAVILCGGSGSRLGGIDKGLLTWRDRSFIELIVERIAPQVSQVLINSNRSTPYPGVELPLVPDPWPDQRGPLAGLLAGLEAATDEWVLFVPCDCPLPAADLTQRLWAAVDEATDLAYAGIGSDNHYLFCLMHRSLCIELRRFLEQGGSAVHRWIATLRSRRVNFDDAAESFLNINSASELESLRKRR